ncbi:MAG: hypothetical protein HY899_07425 [Deltaproteobacteria bacterium]|nr:hypothetical protein [Deltaproteobacteria bacterium]
MRLSDMKLRLGKMSLARRLGWILATLHVVAFLFVLLSVRANQDPQAPMLWSVMLVIDLPVTLFFFPLAGLIEAAPSDFWMTPLGYVLYPPHVIGVLATILWFHLPRLFLPARCGGFWLPTD